MGIPRSASCCAYSFSAPGFGDDTRLRDGITRNLSRVVREPLKCPPGQTLKRSWIGKRA